MDINIKITYSDKVLKAPKQKLRQDIMDAATGSREMRKEIQRVAQMANRRIQNVEKAGVISPAVQALNRISEKYTKFGIGGLSNEGDDWVKARREYAKIIAFLNNPTSTAKGAREFESGLRKHMETSYWKSKVSNDVWQDVKHSVVDNFTAFERDRIEKMNRSSDRVAETFIQKAIHSTEQLMKRDARNIERDIQKRLENESNKVEKQFEKHAKDDMNELLKKLGFTED